MIVTSRFQVLNGRTLMKLQVRISLSLFLSSLPLFLSLFLSFSLSLFSFLRATSLVYLYFFLSVQKV